MAESQDLSAYSLKPEELEAVSKKCIDAKSKAVCHYSRFPVGASILTRSGTWIIGANVEVASTPCGTCAERVALGTAIIQGFKYGDFKALGVAANTATPCSPCGMCRQFIAEYCEPSMPVVMHNRAGEHIIRTVNELLPLTFSKGDLTSAAAAP